MELFSFIGQGRIDPVVVSRKDGKVRCFRQVVRLFQTDMVLRGVSDTGSRCKLDPFRRTVRHPNHAYSLFSEEGTGVDCEANQMTIMELML